MYLGILAVYRGCKSTTPDNSTDHCVIHLGKCTCWCQSRVWRRHQHKPEVQKLYQSKLLLAQQLLSDFFTAHPHDTFPVTFDNWYTQPAFCRFLNKTLKVPYVGTLAGDDLVVLQQELQRLEVFDAHLQQEHQQAIKDSARPIFHKLSIAYKGAQETYYSYCKIHHIHNFGKQRLVINHRKADLSDAAAY